MHACFCSTCAVNLPEIFSRGVSLFLIQDHIFAALQISTRNIQPPPLDLVIYHATGVVDGFPLFSYAQYT